MRGCGDAKRLLHWDLKFSPSRQISIGTMSALPHIRSILNTQSSALPRHSGDAYGSKLVFRLDRLTLLVQFPTWRSFFPFPYCQLLFDCLFVECVYKIMAPLAPYYLLCPPSPLKHCCFNPLQNALRLLYRSYLGYIAACSTYTRG